MRAFFKNETDLAKYAWYNDNADGSTHPVGLLQPIMIDGKNFHELYGNVWEWGWDKYIFNLGGYREKDPVGLRQKDEESHWIVGGGWFDDSDFFFTSPFGYTAAFESPHERNYSVGFRLVRTIEQSDGE